MVENFATKTIREIAIENPATTRVFEEFSIDYCCGGKRSFDDACQHAGVAAETVSRKIAEVLNAQNGQSDLPEQKTASALIDYIVATHHVFTKDEIIRLGALIERVCRKHSPQHKELFELENEFCRLFEDLLPHMKKEETVLFPFIKHLELSGANGLSSPRPPFGTVKNPVRMMTVEHDAAGDILRNMRQITNDYTVPDDACPSYRALYHGLEELEKDLHKHIHLENNVLFPRAIELEEEASLI